MNMKKVLAVVMAVMLAISAMAVTAFAADYTINLSAAWTKGNGSYASTVEFTIPVWPEYGYATAGDTITLTLPASYSVTEGEGEEAVTYTAFASYAVVANGVSYALGTTDTDALCDYVVTFGTLAHAWDGTSTVIPQSVVVGDNATLTVIGTYTIAKDADGNEKVRVSADDFMMWNHPEDNNWNDIKFNHSDNWVPEYEGSSKYVFSHYTYTYEVKAVANDDPNATSYSWSWNPVDGSDVAAADSTGDAGLTGLKWDATLVNKAAILNAETAKVVVKLNKTLVGNYYFGLTATYANGLNYELGGNFNDLDNDTKGYAAYVEIEEPTDTITFEIPVAVLYSANYGVFNESMTVVCIDLFHQTMIDTINASTVASGTIGDYSWTTNSAGNKVISFCGQELQQYWNQFVGTANCKGGPVTAASVDIIVSYADVAEDTEDVVVNDPVQSDTEETEDVVVEEPEDTNPGTGIALAVVPMIVAAAAVVASKRR